MLLLNSEVFAVVQLKEASAASAVAHQKLQNAAEQLRRAANELEQAFEPAHRPVVNEFGEKEGEEFYDPVGRPSPPALGHACPVSVSASRGLLSWGRMMYRPSSVDALGKASPSRPTSCRSEGRLLETEDIE